MKKQTKKGFTIVELVIVVAVIGILAAILIPTFVNLTNRARGTSDDVLVENLNKQLSIQEQQLGYEKQTLHNAVTYLEDHGYKVENLKPESSALLWNQEDNRFVLETKKDTNLESYKYWKVYDRLADATEGYSIYANAGFDVKKIDNLTVGFDVGYNDDITNLTYVGDENVKTNVLFRADDRVTTSFLQKNANDTVHTYGNFNGEDALNNGHHSLHVHGNIATLNITTGRVVLEKGASVKLLYISSKDATSFNENVTIEVGPGASFDVLNRDSIGTNLSPEDRVPVCTIKTAALSETYYMSGNGVIGEDEADSNFYVSTTGDVADAVKVTEATASANAVALANAKGIGGEVIDTGLTEEAKTEKIEEVQAEAQEEIVEQDEQHEEIQYAARIGTKGYLSFLAAYSAAVDGDTISLLEDVNLTKSSLYQNNRFYVTKSLTIDGRGNNIRVINRGFGIATPKFTFKNVNINNSSAGARCIDVRTNDVAGVFVEEVNLSNVKLSTQGGTGYTQPLTIGGNASGATYRDPSTGLPKRTKINITNNTSIATQDNAGAYYSIIAFNPIDLTIKDSSIKGWANIYLKPSDSSYGSRGSNVTLINTTLDCNNLYSGATNSFGMIVFEDPSSYSSTRNESYNITLIGCDVKVYANSDQKQGFLLYSYDTKANINIGEGNTFHFIGNSPEKAVVAYRGSKCFSYEVGYQIANGTVFEALSEEVFINYLDPETQTFVDNGDGTYTVVPLVA